MDTHFKIVRSFKKLKPIPEIPEIPTYVSAFLSNPPLSPHTSLGFHAEWGQENNSAPHIHQDPVLLSPYNEPAMSTQPRLAQSRQSNQEKLDAKFARMEHFLQDSGFDSIGEFLKILFYNPSRSSDEADPRGTCHIQAVAHFLTGRNKIKMSDIIPLIYAHKNSAPSPDSPRYAERHASFSPSLPLTDIFYARPALFSWATTLVSSHVYHEIDKLSRANVSDNHLQASSNGRRQVEGKLVTWDSLSKFNIAALCKKYQMHAPVAWHITESMAARHKNGVFVLKRRRPHPIIQASAISSFILARNRFANGDLAMALGVWHFAAKSHIDVKRVYSRLGNVVSDNTVRSALKSMAESSLLALRKSVKAATNRGETQWCLILDNVQQYCPVYEGGISRESVLKIGTAATAIRLEDCKPGAFDLSNHLDRVAKMERKKMTPETLFNDIDWNHLQDVQALHWARVLINYVPELNFLASDISARFRTPPIALHCMREGRKTVVQPLGTNSEREIETQGMARALFDFDEQMGLGPESAANLLSWVRGDGASYATILRLQKYLCPLEDNHESFRNRITTPEIWHTRATQINSIAENHYGPATSKDPSSLSRSSNAAGFKRPPNLSSCDFYPTVRSMTLIWEARVLDCWRLFLNVKPNLLAHFTELANQGQLPSADVLLNHASILVDRYASQDAYQQSLSTVHAQNALDPMKIPFGSAWTDENSFQRRHHGTSTSTEASSHLSSHIAAESLPNAHQESNIFDGDRVLANSILFLQDFGQWIECAYAVSEGDIGRVFEILKIWIFQFSGSSHQNYMTYLLEVYCFLRYDASKDLRDAILNNWLINVTGELGKWIEGDLLQEHYNRWLEDMVQKRGGDFDDNFYRHTLAPNVEHFLRIKEEIENTFDLKARGKTHTSPHLRDELRVLLKLYDEEGLHLFCAGRSLGHAAVNQLDQGYEKLHGGKMQDFIEKSTTFGDILAGIRSYMRPDTISNPIPNNSNENAFEINGPHTGNANELTNLSDTISTSGNSSPRPTTPTTSSSTKSLDSDMEDLDNSHLCNGSEYNIIMDRHTLMHDNWYEEDSDGCSSESGADDSNT